MVAVKTSIKPRGGWLVMRWPPHFLQYFALAERRLRKGLDILCTFGDAHGFGLPQAEGVHRTARPRAARAAMAIAHRFRRACDLDRDRATEAVSNMFH